MLIASTSSTGADPRPGVVRHLPIPESDAALVEALLAERPGAADALFQRYADYVRRVLVRVMNIDAEIQDLVQDVFVDVLATVDRLNEPKALKRWIASIAVYKARLVIRQRKRRSWLNVSSSTEVENVASNHASPELSDALRRTYDVLDKLPVDERITFVLHIVEGMDLPEIAQVCRVSPATVKRRLRRAKERFSRRAREYPVLAERLQAGTRWNLLSGLEDLGRDLAKEQDKLAQHIDLSAARMGLRASAQTPRKRRASRRTVATLGLAVAGAVAVAAGVAIFYPQKRLEFRVADPTRTLDQGGWISAPKDQPVPVEFSDGSRFVLAGGTRGRVVHTAKAGAELLVERGHADLAIVPRRGNDWLVDLGPYAIRVTGTRFSVDWNPEKERLVVVLREGSIAVNGCALLPGTTLHAGQMLRVSCLEAKYEISSGTGETAEAGNATPGEAPSKDGREPSDNAGVNDAEGSGGAAVPSSPRSAERVAPQANSAPSWRGLAAEGHYKEALAAAEASGFEAECQRATPADLMALGTAARFASSPAKASLAYQTLRRRFPADSRASLAAFNLARIAFDQMGNYGESATWLRTYLREQPAGPLAQEASGRLMEALHRAGDVDGARKVAERYLVQYPDGSHTDLAKRLVR